MTTPILDGALLRPTQIAASKHLVHLSPRLAGGGAACLDAVNLLHFTDHTVSAPLLGSELAMSSVVACYDAYCTPEMASAGWDELGVYFAKYTHAPLPAMDSFRDVGTRLPEVDALGGNITGRTFDQPVLVNRESWLAGCRTEAEWDRQVAFHHAFGWSIYFLLVCMFLLGLGNRLWTLKVAARPIPEADASSPLITLWGRVHTAYRRRVGSPATFGYRHLQPWGILSIPTRIQAIFIAIYVALNVIWSCVGYRTFDENLFWFGRRDMQLARYVADRTGIMSFYNLPLLWLLAGRNDFLIWITGWSYQSCNLFHRWVARVATLQAIVHSAAYSWLESDSLAAQFAQRTWATGVFATVAMCVILASAIRPVRERTYELFLGIHITMAVAVLVLLFLHVKNFGTAYHAYLWACVGVWAFDRTARLIRILAFSAKAAVGGRNALGLLTHPSASGFIRIAIRTPRALAPRPGAYFFIYFSALAPFANHPFTLASWRRTTNGGTELHFLCKPRGGSTSALRRCIERASESASTTTNQRKGEQYYTRDNQDAMARVLKMSVLLEGPYGTSHPVERYERVLLIAGGSGITAVLPYVFELARREAPAKDVTVVWMVHEAGPAEDVLVNELRQSAIGHANVDVWVTSGSESTSTPSSSFSTSDPNPPIGPSAVAPLGTLEMMTSLPSLPARPPSPAFNTTLSNHDTTNVYQPSLA